VVTIALAGRRGKFLLGAGGAILACALIANAIPESWLAYVTRGDTTPERLSTFGGRVSYWDQSLHFILRSPLWGWGGLAGRTLRIGEVHNTYLAALLTSGLLGAGAMVAGLLIAWLYVAQIAMSGVADRLGERISFAQVGGLLAFFTLRSIPEECGSLFNVDLMVMLPAISLLAAMHRRIKA